MAQASTVPQQGYSIELNPPHDRDAKRDKFTRWVVFTIVVAIVTSGPVLFFGYWGLLFGWPRIGSLVGLVIAGFLLIPVLKRMLIYNPEWSAYVTQDVFAGINVPYGPGLHPSFFWEERNKEGNYSLRAITRTFSVSVQTGTAQVTAEGIYLYVVSLERITNFIGVDETTIQRGFEGFIQSFLLARYAGKTAEEARAEIQATNEALRNEFMGNTRVVQFEEKYGIDTVGIIMSNLKVPEAVQKARDAIDEAATLHKIVAAMLGIDDMTLKGRMERKEISKQEYRDLLNRAMATSDNAKMEIKVFEADIPEVIDRVFNLFGQGKRGQGRSREQRQSKPQ